MFGKLGLASLIALAGFSRVRLVSLSWPILGKLGLDILVPLGWPIFGKLGVDILVLWSWLMFQ